MNTKEPMNIKTISKDDISKWLDSLGEYRLYGPVKRENYSEYTEINKSSELNLNIRNTIISPKNLILKQTQTLYEFNLNKSIPEIKVPTINKIRNKKQIILGIRPCDVHGILALDPTFDSEFKDPYFLNIRNKTLLIGLACNQPDINCFCTSLESGPYDHTGMDIMMIDIGSEYLFHIYTPNSQKLVEQTIDLFNEPGSDQLKRYKSLKASAESTNVRILNTENKPEKLGKIFESDYWYAISKKCLSCGICTYLCPTCYCFDITDEKRGQTGQRVRTWDSCMYPEYTVHASGYNPRPARSNRLRNRFYHKFKYYPDLYKIFGCTGCGRCIKHCPVNIDIIHIINGVDEIKIEVEGDS